MAGPQLARDEAGNIWDMSSGQPRLVTPAHSGSPNVVVPSAPPEPKFVPGKPYVYNPQTHSADPIPGLPAETPPAPNFIPGKPGFVVGGAPGAPQAIPIAGLPQAAPEDQNSSATRAAALQGYSYAQQLQTTIDDLNTLYAAGPGSTKGVEGLKDYLPYTANQQFDTKANAARGIVGQSLNFTGGQLNTPQESEKAVGPYLPQAGDRDEVIKQKIKTLQDLADAAREKSIQQLGGIPDQNGNITPVPPPQQPGVPQPPAADPLTQATGQTRDVVDPMLRAVGQKVGGMLSAGVADDKILKFLTDSGIEPGSTSIGKALQFRQSKDFKLWQRHNPGAPYPLGPEFYTKKVPMSSARQIFNKTAATDVGGDVAAGLAASANAISGGRLDNLAPDPEMARTGMDLLRGQHPISSFAGDLAGQASLEALAGTVPGAQGLLATRWGRRGMDAAYGAYSGSGESDGNAGVGALTGAASGLGLGMFGRGAQRGLGRAATGVQNAHLQYLDKLGIPLTIGRIGRGSENVAGQALGGIEERLAGLPISDAIINSARKRGDHAFNSAAFREVGGSGATGGAGLDEARGLVDNAYSFLDNTALPLDAQYAGSQAGVRAALPGLPAFGGEIGKGLNLLDKQAAGGSLLGRDWQSGIRSVRANRSSVSGQPFSDEATNVLGDVENNMMGLASRQGPAGTINNLAKANKLHGQVQTLASALDNGPTQKADEIFSAGRLDDAARAGARKFGGRISSLTGNRPFFDLTSAGKAVMPDLTPDSGTAGRSLLYSALLGAGGGGAAGFGTADSGEGTGRGAHGAEIGTGLALALAAPYSKTGQRVIQKALLSERPEVVRAIGNFLLKKNPKLAGMFGSAVGRDYFFQPELSGAAGPLDTQQLLPPRR